MVSPEKLITEVLPIFPLLLHVNLQKGLSRQTSVCQHWLVVTVVQAFGNCVLASNDSFSFSFFVFFVSFSFNSKCLSHSLLLTPPKGGMPFNWQLSVCNSELRSLSPVEALEKQLGWRRWSCFSQGPCEGGKRGLQPLGLASCPVCLHTGATTGAGIFGHLQVVPTLCVDPQQRPISHNTGEGNTELLWSGDFGGEGPLPQEGLISSERRRRATRARGSECPLGVHCNASVCCPDLRCFTPKLLGVDFVAVCYFLNNAHQGVESV